MKDDFKEFVDNYKKDPEKVKQRKQAKLERKKNKPKKTVLDSIISNDETITETPPTYNLPEPQTKFESFDSLIENKTINELTPSNSNNTSVLPNNNDFYSPLVKSIATVSYTHLTLPTICSV